MILAQNMLGEASTVWTATGLLGAVLSWLLLKHLPDKDKMILQLVEKFEKSVNEQREECKKQVELLSKALGEKRGTDVR